MALSLAEKIGHLIEFAHRFDEPEMSNEQIAAHLSVELGRSVEPSEFAALRDGSALDISRELATALCKLCGVTDVRYLLPVGDEDIDIDLRLQLWTLARDRGVQHVAARAMNRGKLRELIADLRALPARAR